MLKRSIKFLLLFLFLSTTSVNAQSFDTERAFQDYLFQQTSYTESYEEYTKAKSFYLKNPTLQLKEEARKKTLEMLKSRDQLMKVYLSAIRTALSETKGLDGSQKDSLVSKIDPEISWYGNHLASYSDSDELPVLFSKSDESKNRYNKDTQVVVLESLFYTPLSEEINLRKEHEAVYADLKNYINDQVALGKLSHDPFNRWINDTDAVLQSIVKSEDLAKKRLEPLYSEVYNPIAVYASAVQVLTTSLGSISQLNRYLGELLIAIGNLSL